MQRVEVDHTVRVVHWDDLLVLVEVVEEWGEDSPGSIQLVVTDKVRVVSLQGIQDQGLVSLWDLEVGEAAAVGEIELGDNGLHAQTWKLRVHLDVDRLVWLDAHNKLVTWDVLEDTGGNILELDADLSLLLVQSLAGLEDERNAIPTLVLNVSNHSAEGWAPGILWNGIVLLVSWLVAIKGLAILADNDVLWLNGWDGLENANFLISDILGGERDWTLHRQQGQNLQEMVLHDITDDAKLIEVTSTTLGAKWFLEGDLDVIDVIAVPSCVEERVAESENEDVLDHLLSEVVINAEDLLLLPVWCESRLKISRALQVLTKWLLDLQISSAQEMKFGRSRYSQ